MTLVLTKKSRGHDLICLGGQKETPGTWALKNTILGELTQHYGGENSPFLCLNNFREAGIVSFKGMLVSFC